MRDKTFLAHGSHWRVASGVRGSTGVHAKVYFIGRDIFWLKIRYPKTGQGEYGGMVTHVAESFVPSVKA